MRVCNTFIFILAFWQFLCVEDGVTKSATTELFQLTGTIISESSHYNHLKIKILSLGTHSISQLYAAEENIVNYMFENTVG